MQQNSDETEIYAIHENDVDRRMCVRIISAFKNLFKLLIVNIKLIYNKKKLHI